MTDALRHNRRRAFALAAGLIAVGLGCWWAVWGPGPSAAERLETARDLLSTGAWPEAERLALSVAKEGRDPWAWIVAGEAAARSNSPGAVVSKPVTASTGSALDRAVSHYRMARQGIELSPQTEPLWLASSTGAAEILFGQRRWSLAEAELQAAAMVTPIRPEVSRRLADLANFSGRRDAAVPHLLRLLGSPRSTLDDLFHLGDVDHGLDLEPQLIAAAANPDADPLLVMAAGALARGENRAADAVRLYNRAVESRPDDPATWGGLGLALFESRPEELGVWRDRLPVRWRQEAPASLPVGLLQPLSRLSEQQGEFESALRFAAAEAHARTGSRVAWHRLGRLLTRTGRVAEAKDVESRAAALLRLSLWLDDLFKYRTHADLLRRVTDQLRTLGRHEEARAWATYAVSVLPAANWAREVLHDSQPEASDDPLLALTAALSGDGRTLGQATATPGRPDLQSSRDPGRSVGTAPIGSLRFEDVAAAVGLEYVHKSARDLSTPGARIIETTGGGVAVVDYDLDGRPDLYFPQGAAVAPDPAQGFRLSTSATGSVDRLFQSTGERRYRDSTVAAGLSDQEFGQGVAAGDLDSDGFPDLYVANIGPNRLHLNLGDGTFLDVTPAAMSEAPVWTSSCVIADLSGDGHPDLFDATYCAGRDILTRMCGENGVVRSCSPRAFAAESDRLWINAGDGSWQAAGEGLDLADGFGLGLAVFRPSITEPLSVFVANDETPNHWLVNTAEPGASPRWQDRATAAGLAVDADGRPQACMGVACDDLNGDGLIDLFVTNFYHESNTFYRALSPALFVDETRGAGLREPSWNMLGFGTQALDADADGDPDLLVANGHIDDLSAQGEPFEMPLQLFHNRSGLFTEVPSEAAGAVFQRRSLGRGMARLDWNRDGLDDAVVVNQGAPAMLLENRTASEAGAGARIVVTLVGTASSRDAIGTIVEARFGGRSLTRQLTAGDGFQASNERRLLFGLGDHVGPVELRIHWPSGRSESRRFEIATPRAVEDARLVEGRDSDEGAGLSDR